MEKKLFCVYTVVVASASATVSSASCGEGDVDWWDPDTVNRQPSMSRPSVSRQSSVTRPSVSRQSSVTRPSVSRQSSVTRPSVTRQSSVPQSSETSLELPGSRRNLNIGNLLYKAQKSIPLTIEDVDYLNVNVTDRRILYLVLQLKDLLNDRTLKRKWANWQKFQTTIKTLKNQGESLLPGKLTENGQLRLRKLRGKLRNTGYYGPTEKNLRRYLTYLIYGSKGLQTVKPTPENQPVVDLLSKLKTTSSREQRLTGYDFKNFDKVPKIEDTDKTHNLNLQLIPILKSQEKIMEESQAIAEAKALKKLFSETEQKKEEIQQELYQELTDILNEAEQCIQNLKGMNIDVSALWASDKDYLTIKSYAEEFIKFECAAEYGIDYCSSELDKLDLIKTKIESLRALRKSLTNDDIVYKDCDCEFCLRNLLKQAVPYFFTKD